MGKQNLSETQCDLILRYMVHHGAITPMIALKKFHVMRLASRINDLRRRGQRIATTIVHTTNADNVPVRYARYTLEGVTTDEVY